MKKELSIQVFSVRDRMETAEQVAETFKALASYGYTGIQTASEVAKVGVEAYAAAAKAAGLQVIGTHRGLDTFEDMEETIRFHQTLGTTNAGIGGAHHLLQGVFDKQKVLNFIDKANAIGEALAKHGMKFTYHHHAKEFARVGSGTVMDMLVDGLDPRTTSFVLDTCWLQAGCVSVTEWIENLAGRVDILHLKDRAVVWGTNDGVFTELGAGNINFKEVIRVAEAAGVQHYCYELDNYYRINSLESARESAEYYFSLFL